MSRPSAAIPRPNDQFDRDRVEAEVSKTRLARFPHVDRSWVDRSYYYKRQGHLNEVLFSVILNGTLLRLESDRKPVYRFTKQLFDRLLGLALFVLLAPLLAAAALAVKLSSPGPVLFRQLRVGYLGQVFWVFKFRTMYDGAEQGVRTIRPMQKLIADPRSTRVGRFLRRRKIDELPQLLNVILGDMSLVGPRPLSLDESATTPMRLMRRFSVRPGLTGLWQANRPNTISGVKKLCWDARYADRCSWSLDLLLLLRTLRVVARGESEP